MMAESAPFGKSLGLTSPCEFADRTAPGWYRTGLRDAEN